MIETVYRVRCSGPCRRYLTPDGPERGDYPDLDQFDSSEAASDAATKAGWKWIFPLDHAFEAGWLGNNSCCRGLPLVGCLQGYCTRPIADHQLVGPYCPDCATRALADFRAAQQAWWTEEVQRRAVAAGEG